MIVEYATTFIDPVLGASTRYRRKTYRFRWWGRYCLWVTNHVPMNIAGCGLCFMTGKEVTNGKGY